MTKETWYDNIDIYPIYMTMASHFTDETTRQEYVVSITKILCQIFDITDGEKKQALYSELAALDDADLVEKQKYIEEHLMEKAQMMSSFLSQISLKEHLFEEEQEKSELTLSFSF